jgi:hypothetical protein
MFVILVYFSLLLFVLSGVPQGSVLGLCFFIFLFRNDSYDVRFRFAVDLKAYRAVSSPSDCLPLQSEIDCVHEWCSANFMNRN